MVGVRSLTTPAVSSNPPSAVTSFDKPLGPCDDLLSTAVVVVGTLATALVTTVAVVEEAAPEASPFTGSRECSCAGTSPRTSLGVGPWVWTLRGSSTLPFATTGIAFSASSLLASTSPCSPASLRNGSASEFWAAETTSVAFPSALLAMPGASIDVPFSAVEFTPGSTSLDVTLPFLLKTRPTRRAKDDSTLLSFTSGPSESLSFGGAWDSSSDATRCDAVAASSRASLGS
mmetsp:Transcript_6319/g.16257  ORF Transcript_6319/g.16257 Transcript_6319/m.16257 type:complete len:231 (-) Transcript_6319:11-703(-)